MKQDRSVWKAVTPHFLASTKSSSLWDPESPSSGVSREGGSFFCLLWQAEVLGRKMHEDGLAHHLCSCASLGGKGEGAGTTFPLVSQLRRNF